MIRSCSRGAALLDFVQEYDYNRVTIYHNGFGTVPFDFVWPFGASFLPGVSIITIAPGTRQQRETPSSDLTPLVKSLEGFENAITAEGATFIVDDNQLTSLGGLPTAKDLVVSANGNAITSLDGLSADLRLKSLYLKNNELTSLKGIHVLNGTLKTLDVSNNQIDEFSIVPSSVETLDAGNTNLASLRQLEHLTNLRELRVSFVPDAFRRFKNGRSFFSLGKLPPFNKLTKLQASGNGITSLSRLNNSAFEGLEILYLNNNAIDGRDLAKVSALPTLSTLAVSDNGFKSLNEVSVNQWG